MQQITTTYREKALLDLLYYVSYGKETISLNELYLKNIDKKRWRQFSRIYPPRVKKLINQLKQQPC